MIWVNMSMKIEYCQKAMNRQNIRVPNFPSSSYYSECPFDARILIAANRTPESLFYLLKQGIRLFFMHAGTHPSARTIRKTVHPVWKVFTVN